MHKDTEQNDSQGAVHIATAFYRRNAAY